VTETYPFGRRQMRFELTPLLDWIKEQPKPPVLVASIRDILQRRSPVREQECLKLVQDRYQHILVHGDPAFYPLQKSFPPATAINDKLHYSGYVCPTLSLELSTEQLNNCFSNQAAKTIVVSIGGGSVGKEILAAALLLYKSGYANDLNWLLITGPNMPAKDQAYFKAQQTDNLQVMPLADNFLNTLQNAHVSISMAGYNTVMDLLLTKVPAVVIPFEGEGETEQMARSQVLAAVNVLQLITNKALNKYSLQDAIQRAVNQTSVALKIDNQGAQKSATLLIDWAHKAQGVTPNV
jgi:predicted glycosyltransferase